METITCKVCGKKVPHDNINGLKFRRKSFCVECFENEYDSDVVDKHYVQIKFQEVTGRVPTKEEWMQFEKLMREYEWDWNIVYNMLDYVYLIELVPIDEERLIWTLPFYRKKALKFQKQLEGVYASLEDDFEDEVVTVYVRQLEKPKKEVKLTSIDDLIDWSEEEEWQE